MTIYWQSLSEFLAMGGYAGYVWGSFGATALIMLAEPIVAIRRRTSLIARLKRQTRAERESRSPRNTEEQ